MQTLEAVLCLRCSYWFVGVRMEHEVNNDWNQPRLSVRRSASCPSVVMQIPQCTTTLCRCNKLVFQSCQIQPRKVCKGVCRDRISSLPDAILSDILSLLPTKEAVATSVLSKRWSHLFSWITFLEFDVSPISHCSENRHMTESFPTFKNFVDSVLEACQADNINTFKLNLSSPSNHPRHKCYGDCFPALEPSRLLAWIHFPLTRTVRQFDLCAILRNLDVILPSDIFCCPTLEVLKLKSNLELEVPLSPSLPNVKVLHLTSHDTELPEVDFLNRLLSSCPLLEDLVLKGELTVEDPLNISAPCLRRAVLDIFSDDAKRHILFDTPNLEYLDYVDSAAVNYSITTMNALVEAHLDIVVANSNPVTVLPLVISLFNVRNLSLLYGCLEGLEECESLKQTLPVFRNLRHLQLGQINMINWRLVLLDLLDCSPFLETLAFPEGLGSLYIYEESEIGVLESQYWNTIQTIPSCLKLHLRSVAVQKFLSAEVELPMIKYFLRNALLLEELVIECHEEMAIADKISLDSSLQNLPRGSVTCSIEVK